MLTAFILHKKLAIWIVVIAIFGFFSSPATVNAAAIKVEATVDMKLQLFAEGRGSAEYRLALTNNESKLISQISLPIVATQPTNTAVTRNGNNVPFTISNQTNFSQFNLDLSAAPVRTGESLELIIRFDSQHLAQFNHGMYELLLPKLEANYEVSKYTLDLEFDPQLYPPLEYSSAVDTDPEPGKVKLQSQSGFWLIWGLDTVWDIELSTKLTQSGIFMLNLIPESATQGVVYESIQNISAAVTDRLNNLWGISDISVAQQIGFKARVHNQKLHNSRQVPDDVSDNVTDNFPGTLLDINYPDVEIPSVLKEILATSDKPKQVDLIHQYMLDTYSAAGPGVVFDRNKIISGLPTGSNSGQTTPGEQSTSAASGAQSGSALANTSPALTQIEFSLYEASLLQQVGFKVNVGYGYIYSQLDLVNTYDLTSPQVWVEVEVDGEVRLLDTYYHEVTQWQTFGTFALNRVKLGAWDPANSRDSVLGLMTGNPLRRPQLVNLGEISPGFDYKIDISFPETVLAGTYFEGDLRITNNSAHALLIDSIILDNQDVTAQVVSVFDEYKVAVLPYSSTTIKVPQLVNMDLLNSSTKTGKVTVKPHLDFFSPQIARYQINFTPNYALTFGGIAAIGVTFSLIVIYIYRRKVIVSILSRRYR